MHWFTPACKEENEMEMPMQEPGDMWAGIDIPVSFLADRDRGRKACFA